MSADELRQRYPGLTARQAEVTSLYERGMSMRAIAQALCLDRSTVRKHLNAASRRIVAAERQTAA